MILLPVASHFGSNGPCLLATSSPQCKNPWEANNIAARSITLSAEGMDLSRNSWSTIVWMKDPVQRIWVFVVAVPTVRFIPFSTRGNRVVFSVGSSELDVQLVDSSSIF